MENYPYSEPVWRMFECEQGNRWTAVKDGICDDIKEGDACYFSGCSPDHKVHIKGATADRTKAHDWFRNIRHEVSQ